MENKNYCQMDNEILDVKELIFFILRKWRVLFLAGIIGLVVGCCFGLFAPERRVEWLELDKLHLEEIDQYARYQEIYNEQLRKGKESVYMNLDPEAVHMYNKLYYIKAYEADINHINEMYNSILRDEHIYHELIEASGLQCSEIAMQELVTISFEKYEIEENDFLFGSHERDALVTVRAVAPEKEACEKMMTLLDEWVRNVNSFVASKYPNIMVELLSDTYRMGYDSEIMTKRRDYATLLATYISEMEKLEKKFSDDDKLYYQEVYAIEKSERGMTWLKWGLIVGVLFGGMLIAFYGVVFLLDGHVKTIDELKRVYGLHIIACLKDDKKVNKCVIDRMLTGKQQYNSMAYLRAVLMEEPEVKTLHLCGDMENAQLAATMKLLAGENGVTISHRMALDENARLGAREADGVVMFVQLWNTKHAELVRELEIATHINARVLGVVVLN